MPSRELFPRTDGGWTQNGHRGTVCPEYGRGMGCRPASANNPCTDCIVGMSSTNRMAFSTCVQHPRSHGNLQERDTLHLERFSIRTH